MVQDDRGEHADVRGQGAGYLNTPDDAYLLSNGLRTVADAYNCRVLFINHAKRLVREIGHAGSCTHDPPVGLSSPNGATPLAAIKIRIMCWVTRAENSATLRLHRGETNAATAITNPAEDHSCDRRVMF